MERVVLLDRRPRRVAVVAGWLLTRAFVVWVTAAYFEGDWGTYYREGSAWLAGQVPYRDFLVEYPPAALLVFAALAAVGSFRAFGLVFILLALAFDACIFSWLLRDARGRAASAGQVGYVAATALLFPVLYLRFDLLPAAATLIGCLLLEAVRQEGEPAGDARRLVVGGALLGLGVAWKLYPLLFLPLLGLHALPRGGWLARRRRLLLLLGPAAAVVGLSFLPALAAGAGRAIGSFLRYQGERGLQIESGYASLLLIAHVVHPLDLHHRATHQAHDLAGPLADAIAPWTRPVQLGAVLLVSWLAFRRRLPLPRAFAAVVAAALVTANVFSPQFLLWLVPLAAAACAGRSTDDLVSCGVLLAAAGLTTLVFPTLYAELRDLRIEAILPLLLRNILVLWLVVRLARPGVP